MSNLPKNSTDQSCPECGSHLVVRKRKSGTDTGSLFFGCSTYPKCRHTREAEPGETAKMPAVELTPRKDLAPRACAFSAKAIAATAGSRKSRPKAPFSPPPQFNRGHRIRRKDQSNFEIVLSLVSWMPWWVNVLLAVAVFEALHHLGLASAQTLQATRESVGASTQISLAIGSFFFSVMKWLALLFFIRAAFASVVRSKWKRRAATGMARPKVAGVRAAQQVTPKRNVGAHPTPDCPLCGAEMRLRTRKSDGQEFYGCTHFPVCKGMVNG